MMVSLRACKVGDAGLSLSFPRFPGEVNREGAIGEGTEIPFVENCHTSKSRALEDGRGRHLRQLCRRAIPAR